MLGRLRAFPPGLFHGMQTHYLDCTAHVLRCLAGGHLLRSIGNNFMTGVSSRFDPE